MNIKTFLECNMKEIFSLDNVLIYGVWDHVKKTSFLLCIIIVEVGRKQFPL